jgi:fused signal recognition particle receptor
MEGVTNSELLTAAIVAAGFVAMVLLLVFAIRRARAVRQRQIDAAGEGRPVPMAKGGRPALRAEDVVPERADDLAEEELVAATPAPHVKEEPPTPPPAGPAVGQKAAELAKPLPAARPVVAVPPSPKLEPREAPRPQTRAQPPSPAKLTLTVEKPRPAEAPARRKTRDTAALAPGLARTRAGWVSRLGDLFVAKREIDPALVEEIEKVLLTADIGVRTSQKLLEEIRSSLTRRELADAGAVWDFLRQRCLDFFRAAAPAVDFAKAKPFVLLAIGVNGSGKTTTIGKLASKLKADGKSVLLAAGDTFRAAATEQLEEWGSRVGAAVVRGKESGDPSSVIFDAIKRGASEGVDVVIADTAGRLHTKANLMDELQKVRRVAGKACAGAPHETWLVIDATNGQNAIAQAQIFTQAMAVTGIVLTKLDGTAKGGVILGIADQLGIPVRYVGIGERVQDLREFDAEEFVEALFENAQVG